MSSDANPLPVVSSSPTSDTTADLIPTTKTNSDTTTAGIATETAIGTTDIGTATASAAEATARSSSRPDAAAEKSEKKIAFKIALPNQYPSLLSL